MKLISCDHCATMLDGSKLRFAHSMYDENGIDDDNARYDQNTCEYRLYVPCPVCKETIFE
jgi:hypothetical protein